jgi:tetratricopeptide (TPR) repeat protein
MRISGCSDVIKSGSAAGADLTIAYYNRANARLQKGEYRKAIDDYSKAIDHDPQNASALHERCFARAVIGVDLEDALSDCNESLRIRPNDSETLGGRGFVYLRLQFYRTAIRDYNAALEFKPDTAMFLYARGTAKIQSGDGEGGEADIAAARSLDPKIDAVFEAYDSANETGGMWSAMVGYWRAAMRWLY